MSRALRATWLCAATFYLTACAGHKGPPPSTDIDEAALRDDIRILASDDFEGRRPGSRGEEKTTAFLVEQFKKLGLKPGNGDSYLQTVPLDEISVARDATLSFSNGSGAHALGYAVDMVVWSARETPRVIVAHSEVVFVGYGIVAPEYQWDDYAHVDVRGKTVVALMSDPGRGAKDPRVFRGGAMTQYGTAAYKYDEAAPHGAAAVLLIHDNEATGYGWSTVVNSRSGPHFERPSADGGASRPAFEGFLSPAAGRALFVQAGLNFDGMTSAAAQAGSRATALGLSADAELHLAVRHVDSANVIAVLPGGRLKHEYVLYSAHWDSLGRRAAEAGGGIFNGAVDDASGVAGLLMEAQALSRTQPVADRSIAFVAFTAGEAGLLGSAHYMDNPVIPLRQIAGVLSLDTLHVGGPARDVMVFGFGNSELEEYLKQAAQQHGRVISPEPSPGQGLFYEADHFNFVRSGVPALYAKFGTDDAARGPAWGQSRLDDYRLNRFRQISDTYSSDWDVRGMVEDLRLYYEVGGRLARTRRFPRWYPNSEYRAGFAEKRGPAED